MTETNKTKKQLIIFLLVAYGVTFLMGISKRADVLSGGGRNVGLFADEPGG